MNPKKVLDLLGGLTLLKFFPSEPSARLELVNLVLRMAATYEQIEWLVARTTSVCNEWPGPLVLRQIFCSRFKPRDGIEAGATPMFPDGLPPERRPVQASVLALPPGHAATLDAGLDKAVQIAAAQKSIETVPYTSPADYQHLEELRRARLRRQHREIFEELGLKPVTQEDIDRAVEEAKKDGGEDR
jgi:hypothetical protein